MNTEKVYVFVPEVYPRRLYVVRGKDKGKFIKQAFCGYNHETLDVGDARDSGACTWQKVMLRETGKFGALVWIVNDARPASLAHEAVHVTNSIFKQLDIDMDYEHDEHYAYMVQWVTDCLWQVVTNKFKDTKV